MGESPAAAPCRRAATDRPPGPPPAPAWRGQAARFAVASFGAAPGRDALQRGRRRAIAPHAQLLQPAQLSHSPGLLLLYPQHSRCELSGLRMVLMLKRNTQFEIDACSLCCPPL